MMKKLFSLKPLNYIFDIVLMSIILIFCSTTSYASNDASLATEKKDWIDNSAYYCFIAGKLDMGKDYFISQAFEVLRETKRYDSMYFVFCEGECIGELWVNEQMHSCAFFQLNCEVLTDIYTGKSKISLISPDIDHIYVVTSDNSIVTSVYGMPSKNEQISLSAESFSEISLRLIVFPDYSEVNNRSVVDESNSLNVPLHANNVSPDTGKGLCWIASSLSIVEYLIGNTGDTTIGLYNYLRSLYNPYMHGYPVGTETWICRIFNHYNYTLTDYGPSGLSFSTSKNIIDNNKPIFIGMHNTDGSDGHAIVLRGYSIFSSDGLTYNYSYYLLDSNLYYPGHAIVSAPATGVNFTYGIYTQWTSHYY